MESNTNVTLIAVDPNRLEKLEKELKEIKEMLLRSHEQIDKILAEKATPPQAYEPEYVMMPSALRYTDYKARKIKELAGLRFMNGEPVIRTRKPNGGTKGVTYCVADLKQADLRAENWRKEQQKHTGEPSRD